MAQYESVYRGATVAALDVNTRAQFLSRTYAHLTGAIFAFTLLEIALFKAGLAEKIAVSLTSVSWLLVLGGFMVIGWLATRTAASAATKGAQYLALAGYVVAEAIIFVPLLYVADRFAPGVIASAAVVTFVGFAGLTAVVFVTRRDFSFLRGVLFWGFIVALVLIIASVLFGWNLGTWFSVGMIALAGAAILYDTSNVLLHYPEDRYISAALQLFASVALMFWYVLRLFLRLRD
jgi:uncharacterized protein